MRAFVLGVLAIFLLLVFVTMFGQSESARLEAARYFTDEEIDTGLRLSFERRLFFWAGSALHLGLLLFMTAAGWARRFVDARQDRFGWFGTLILLGLIYFAAERLLSFPIALGRFYHAHAWGLANRELPEWLIDYAKSLGISLVTDFVIVTALYGALRWSPRRWWLIATAGGGLLAVVYALILPVLIEPIFNTFVPLSQTPWADPLRPLLERAEVSIENIYVVDASRQSKYTNAYFTGLGPTQRIVLYDNLVKKHTQAEIESILGHELGHWQHDHIVKGIGLGMIAAVIGFFVLSRLLLWGVDRRPMLLRSPSDPAGLPWILLFVALGEWVVWPVQCAVSRQFETQADRAALKLAGQPEAFKAAEKKMARDNKHNVAPAPFNVWLFATHPPTVERIRMAEEWEKSK